MNEGLDIEQIRTNAKVIKLILQSKKKEEKAKRLESEYDRLESKLIEMDAKINRLIEQRDGLVAGLRHISEEIAVAVEESLLSESEALHEYTKNMDDPSETKRARFWEFLAKYK